MSATTAKKQKKQKKNFHSLSVSNCNRRQRFNCFSDLWFRRFGFLSRSPSSQLGAIKRWFLSCLNWIRGISSFFLSSFSHLACTDWCFVVKSNDLLSKSDETVILHANYRIVTEFNVRKSIIQASMIVDTWSNCFLFLSPFIFSVVLVLRSGKLKSYVGIWTRNIRFYFIRKLIFIFYFYFTSARREVFLLVHHCCFGFCLLKSTNVSVSPNQNERLILVIITYFLPRPKNSIYVIKRKYCILLLFLFALFFVHSLTPPFDHPLSWLICNFYRFLLETKCLLDAHDIDNFVHLTSLRISPSFDDHWNVQLQRLKDNGKYPIASTVIEKSENPQEHMRNVWFHWRKREI